MIVLGVIILRGAVIAVNVRAVMHSSYAWVPILAMLLGVLVTAYGAVSHSTSPAPALTPTPPEDVITSPV
ncbi:hypothetical protein HJC99_03555 [Candidatus Saccharibacteria bacterium]|nr:hypothetical protein [Candidatus Saccharibacteria bacterium]